MTVHVINPFFFKFCYVLLRTILARAYSWNYWYLLGLFKQGMTKSRNTFFLHVILLSQVLDIFARVYYSCFSVPSSVFLQQVLFLTMVSKRKALVCFLTFSVLLFFYLCASCYCWSCAMLFWFVNLLSSLVCFILLQDVLWITQTWSTISSW